MRGSLLPVTQDPKVTSVGACQGCAGRSARGRGPNGSDLTRVQYAYWRSGCGLEQDYQALMRLQPLGEVLRVDANQLGAKGGILTQGTRHDPEEMSACQRDNGAQQLARLAAGKADHGLAHQRDAGLVGQPPGNFLTLNQSHGLRFAGVLAEVWPVWLQFRFPCVSRDTNFAQDL